MKMSVLRAIGAGATPGWAARSRSRPPTRRKMPVDAIGGGALAALPVRGLHLLAAAATGTTRWFGAEAELAELDQLLDRPASAVASCVFGQAQLLGEHARLCWADSRARLTMGQRRFAASSDCSISSISFPTLAGEAVAGMVCRRSMHRPANSCAACFATRSRR